jgi:hypothetical protein
MEHWPRADGELPPPARVLEPLTARACVRSSRLCDRLLNERNFVRERTTRHQRHTRRQQANNTSSARVPPGGNPAALVHHRDRLILKPWR